MSEEASNEADMNSLYLKHTASKFDKVQGRYFHHANNGETMRAGRSQALLDYWTNREAQLLAVARAAKDCLEKIKLMGINHTGLEASISALDPDVIGGGE